MQEGKACRRLGRVTFEVFHVKIQLFGVDGLGGD
jgi:hypothetical protein